MSKHNIRTQRRELIRLIKWEAVTKLTTRRDSSGGSTCYAAAASVEWEQDEMCDLTGKEEERNIAQRRVNRGRNNSDLESHNPGERDCDCSESVKWPKRRKEGRKERTMRRATNSSRGLSKEKHCTTQHELPLSFNA